MASSAISPAAQYASLLRPATAANPPYKLSFSRRWKNSTATRLEYPNLSLIKGCPRDRTRLSARSRLRPSARPDPLSQGGRSGRYAERPRPACSWGPLRWSRNPASVRTRRGAAADGSRTTVAGRCTRERRLIRSTGRETQPLRAAPAWPGGSPDEHPSHCYTEGRDHSFGRKPGCASLPDVVNQRRELAHAGSRSSSREQQELQHGRLA